MWLLLLLAVPPLFLLKGKLGTPATITFSSLSILGTLGTKPKNYAGAFSFILLVISVLASAISLARPQWKTEYTEKTASGVDIIIAVDISLSMIAREEVYGNRTRMDAAKETIKYFIQARPNDRIGIISFAGRPYMEADITLDHVFLLEKLKNIEPNRQYDDGTAIGSAVNAAGTKLQLHDDTKSRIIILITDGSNNTGDSPPLIAAKAAQTLGLKVHTVAIGTKDGRVPNYIQAYPDQEFDTETLKRIAAITNGQYYRAKSTKDLNGALDSIDKLEKTDRSKKTYSEKTEFHFWFTSVALISAIIFVLLQSVAAPPSPE